MFRNAIRWTVLAAALASLPAPAARADYEAGRAAWDAGRHGEAAAEWRAAADRGDARSMLALGRAFVKGLGVPRDYVEAHMWLNLAAGRDSAEAAAERDALAKEMTAGERAEARKLARVRRAGPDRAVPAPQRTGAGTPAAPAIGPPPKRALREAQELLAALGYEPGAADGVWGARTASAYAAFLNDAGMRPGKVLTPEALRAMRRTAAGRGGGAEAADASAAALPRDALHRTARAGDVDGLTAALAAGAEADARDGRGRTALMYAVDEGYTLLVPPLLKAGADPNLRAPDGATALFIATVHGHTEIVVALMEAGADPSIVGPGGKTASEAGRLKYGDGEGVRERDSHPAVVALLRSMTLAEVREEKQPGRAFRDCDACPEMVVVPAGSFTMGSPSHEEGRSDDEGPAHQVTIAAPFAVGKYEVTFAEWDACVAAGGCGGYRSDDRGWGRNDRPMIYVSWKDTQAYVRWLSEETGESYRLLSEAEWEYAARAGTATPYSWGNDIGRNRANCDGCESRWDDESTAPVGSFAANGFGLYDMHGNVWEWVEDCYNNSYAAAPSDGSAWTSGDCSVRVLRGGSWSNRPRYLRSADRIRRVTSSRNSYNGFRVARTFAQ